MVVKCVENTGKYLRQFEDQILEDNQFGKFGVSSQSVMGLDINKNYIVMGISLYNNILNYLVDSGNNDPNFYPSLLFEIHENKIFSNWHFKSFKQNNTSELSALWGYYELCNVDKHYDNLLLREESDLEIYFKRKNEIMKAYEEGYFYTELKDSESYNL